MFIEHLQVVAAIAAAVKKQGCANCQPTQDGRNKYFPDNTPQANVQGEKEDIQTMRNHQHSQSCHS